LSRLLCGAGEAHASAGKDHFAVRGMHSLIGRTGPNPLIEARAKFTHEVLSKLVTAAIALHVTGALKNHFIDRNGALSRMLPFGRWNRAAPDWK
jgi:cytochrome b561